MGLRRIDVAMCTGQVSPCFRMGKQMKSPDVLLAVLMYLAVIFTLLSFYSYLKKGSYIFTS